MTRNSYVALATLFLVSLASHAHEVRPAYLQITETTDHGMDVLWKQPVMGEVAVHLSPHLSGGWLEGAPSHTEVTPGYALKAWRLAPGIQPPLQGQTVSIEGLTGTITDVLVDVRVAGHREQLVLTPMRPAQVLSWETARPVTVPAFLALGIEHILTGADHLLFVLGLLVIVPNRWALFKTVTAFTAAHSVTLALAALGYVEVSVAFIDAMIALSILFLGAEIVRRARGGTSLTLRHPWAAAFGFGLLHGFGFASGLNAVGVARHDLPAALVLFNVGVEMGQLTFVMLVLWLAHVLRVFAVRWPRAMELLPGYVVGGMGGFWLVDRVVGFMVQAG